MLFETDGLNHDHLHHLLWCHCYNRPLKYGKSKCFDTHTDTVETLSPPTMGGFRTTVSTCSEWMESNTKEMWFYPPRTECITHWTQHHDLEWQKARGDTFKLHGKCTIIVVTTMVRFSTEESLETCGSRIFTNREYSFQYPICEEKTVGRWGIPTGWRDKKWACRRDTYYRKLQWCRLIKITRFPEACCLYPKVQLK